MNTLGLAVVHIEVILHGKSYRGKEAQKQLILELLEEGPLNGYQILKRLNEMRIRMSPSSLYSLLTEMEKNGLIRKEKDGRYVKVANVSAEDKVLERIRYLKELGFYELLEALGEIMESLDKLESDRVKEVMEKCLALLNELRQEVRHRAHY